MAVTGTKSVRDICQSALWKIGVIDNATAASADEFARAAEDLNDMLKAWQAKRYNLWTSSTQSVTLTTAASYTLDPVRPLSIESVRLKRSGTEMPMQSLTREEYDTLPVKTTTGTPTTYYYNRQREAAVLYIWPVLAVASGETLEITYTRELEDVSGATAADIIDVPAEWYEAVIYNLADRLADTFMIDAPKISLRAATALRDALAFDREESVYFGSAGR